MLVLSPVAYVWLAFLYNPGQIAWKSTRSLYINYQLRQSLIDILSGYSEWGSPSLRLSSQVCVTHDHRNLYGMMTVDS